MPPSFSVAFSYSASERPHSAAPETWAWMPSGLTWVPTSVATVSFLTVISPEGATATWATQAVQLAGDAGDTHALALGELFGAVAGQAHRGEQGVAQPLRAAGIF